MTSMYITAAPVGAVPKWLDPLEPTFIPSYLLHGLLDEPECSKIVTHLHGDGWETVPEGGLLLQAGYDTSIPRYWLARQSNPTEAQQTLNTEGWHYSDDAWHSPHSSAPESRTIPREWFSDVSSIKLVRQIVLQLTTYGWVATENGDLIWKYPKLSCYFPKTLIDAIRDNCPGLLSRMEDSGWKICGPGYWQPGKARSPFLPITPTSIVDETIRSFQEGAAVVHLHTRDLSDRARLEIPGLGPVTVGSQRNQIVLDHYDAIVPAVKAYDPSAILNLSTSVRGDRHGARSPLRRAHLRPYGEIGTPEIASLSPAAVIFQAGGGYDNAPEFLDAQLDHFLRTGTRPEVEVFNHTIVDNATTLYRKLLEATGKHVLFMLVAGVDQFRRDPVSGEVEDDSLISPEARQEISTALATGEAAAKQYAIELAAEQLSPVVERLRNSFPAAKISILLPGPLQSLLAEVAIRLRLDGVRIGLEDGLNVFDPRVPGGVRKAQGTWEQVRMLRDELREKGINVQTSTQVRDMLEMPVGKSLALAVETD
ncbi:hypothetical protein DIE19_34415 [Burkholderia sp. Bp9126]|nr:hypothetical protein DIE19_34415 [Burkholderia sp. Bp9126]